MSDTEAPTSRETARRPRVLLVDDDPTLLRGLVRLLGQTSPNWQILVAKSVAEALAHLEGTTIDVLMTDLRMPDIDGIALLRIVQERYPTTLRVAHSSQTETLAASSSAGLAQRIVPKPARAKDLTAILQWAEDIDKKVGNGH